MSLSGVVDIAEGICENQPCIKVFVTRRTLELEEKIPCALEGYPVAIVEIANIFPGVLPTSLGSLALSLIAYGLTIPRRVKGGAKRIKEDMRTANRSPNGSASNSTDRLIKGINRTQAPANEIIKHSRGRVAPLSAHRPPPSYLILSAIKVTVISADHKNKLTP